MVHLLAVSLSDNAAIAANKVVFWPINANIDSYREIFSNTKFLRAFMISIARVVSGTALNLLLIVLTAYPLSFEHNRLKGRNWLMWYFVIPMLFGGGLIPTYLLIRNLNLLNKFLVLIVPGALPIFSMILVMNYFRSLPSSLYEAARIDGAGHINILGRIFLPLSLPSLATIALFSVVGHWNSWFDGLIYMTTDKNWPLQTLLQSAITAQRDVMATIQEGDLEKIKKLSERSLTAAKIMVTTIPVLISYPFAQKYFIKGIMLGSVKG
jgi:putative aldouronate transport system permease protein